MVYIIINSFFPPQAHANINKFHIGYTRCHSFEMSLSNAQFVVLQQPLNGITHFSTAHCWCLPPWSRTHLLLLFSEMGDLQIVSSSGEVNLLEMWTMDANNMHVRVVFWGKFAIEVSLQFVQSISLLWLCYSSKQPKHFCGNKIGIQHLS